MRTYFDLLSCALPSGFVWLVFECLSIEKPHLKVRIDGALNEISVN